MPMTKEQPLNYLRRELNGQGDFIPSYKALSEADKTTLKTWAEEEQDTRIAAGE